MKRAEPSLERIWLAAAPPGAAGERPGGGIMESPRSDAAEVPRPVAPGEAPLPIGSAPETVVSESHGIRVRPLRPEDFDQVLALLGGQEFTVGQPPGALRRTFEYPWEPRPHSGFVLVAHDRIVGCAGLLFSERRFDGRERRMACTSTWYVEPGYRRYSRAMLKAALALPDQVLVALSASEHVARILEGSGFRVVSERRLFLGLPPLRELARGADILEDPRELEGVLDDEHRRILRDHLPLDCRHWVVREGGRYCYLVTRRRREKGWFLPPLLRGRLAGRRLPVTDVFFASDPALAMRHWGRLWWRMVRRDRSVGVTAEESFLGGLARPTATLPHHVHVFPRETPTHWVDALYSELLFLE